MISPDTILQDVRYEIRALSRISWATLITVLSLTLGIAVNTAVFTAYKAFVARSFDARNPAEVDNIALTRYSGAADYTSAIQSMKRTGIQSAPSAGWWLLDPHA